MQHSFTLFDGSSICDSAQHITPVLDMAKKKSEPKSKTASTSCCCCGYLGLSESGHPLPYLTEGLLSLMEDGNTRLPTNEKQ